MSERLGVTLGTATVKKLENGITIGAKIIEFPKVEPGPVADHESTHVVASDMEIVTASNIPSGDAKGITIPKKLTAAGAAGPAALGQDGVGWDLYITEHVLGVDIQTAMAQARAKLRGKEEERHEIASLIEERGIIHQSDVNEALENVARRRAGIHTVEVKISDLKGKSETFTIESLKGEIKIEHPLIDLPQAA